MGFDIVYILTVLVVILISMTLHEAMHAFTSYWLGDDTAKAQGRLTLNPLKHIDPFLTVILPIMLAIVGLPIFGGAKPVPFNPQNVRWGEWGAALVALAGPFTNLLIAFITFGVWLASGMSSTAELPGSFFMTIVAVNLGFFVFNMIPIPPLDGSRFIYALAPEFVRRGMEAIERYGIILVFIVVLLAGQYIGAFMSAATNAILQAFMFIFAL